MKPHPFSTPTHPQTLTVLPQWITAARGEDIETVTFCCGAALASLEAVLRGGGVPGALWRDRLALDASAACLKLEGRTEGLSDIRDAACLARPGDALGPAGDMFTKWRRLARINLGLPSWRDHVMTLLPEPLAAMALRCDQTQGSPVTEAARILSQMLHSFPRQEAAAFMLADVSLARAIGWERPVPFLAAKLKRRDLRAIAEGASDTSVRVHQAITAACDSAIRSAADLARRAEKLRAIAPKLRTKGVEHGLALFLSLDAVSPSGMLSPTVQGSSFAMTDRAARRLCDRLVDLGAVREMTGRSTFRLYGL